jgi:uncharacterized protein (DUF3084 family)
MTDIKRRLRINDADGWQEQLMVEAADRIEQLEAALAEETECARQTDHVLARYEAALQGVQESTDLDDAQGIARRAHEEAAALSSGGPS